MVIDIFSYNGEADLLELHLSVLDKYVDQFIIVEASTTFCGSVKPMYFYITQERFKKWEHKIKYHVVDEKYTEEEWQKAKESKYTNGDQRWMWEYLQKESLQKAMTHLNDEDVVYVGDVDEIWEHKEYKGLEKLKLRVYAYYLNLLSTEEFWGPVRCKYKDIKDKCLNDIRNDISLRTEDYQGWHFTNQGGKEAVRKKVIDQYNGEVFNTDLINKNVDINFGVVDYIGRDFKFEVNESDWPQFLKDNRQKYIHLLK